MCVCAFLNICSASILYTDRVKFEDFDFKYFSVDKSQVVGPLRGAVQKS